jgi:electron transport complex protein RnfG
MKKDFVIPIVVLALICLVISAALAFTNSVTAPVIAAAAAARAEAAEKEVIPDATGFEKLDVDGLPKSVAEVYTTTNDVGYSLATAKGYGGDIKIICAIRPDGTVIAADARADRDKGPRLPDRGAVLRRTV